MYDVVFKIVSKASFVSLNGSEPIPVGSKFGLNFNTNADYKYGKNSFSFFRVAKKSVGLNIKHKINI
jgi:hypothetical protein